MTADTAPPVVNSFPSDITITIPYGEDEAPVNWQEPTSTDNSGSSFQTPSQPSGSNFPVGNTPVTYTFTDPAGNTVERTFNVNVIRLRKLSKKVPQPAGNNFSAKNFKDACPFLGLS